MWYFVAYGILWYEVYFSCVCGYDSLRAGRFRLRTPVGARFSSPVPIGHEAHPAFCIFCTVFFPGVKRPGRCVDRPFCLHSVDGVDFRRVYCKRATTGFMHVSYAAHEVLSNQWACRLCAWEADSKRLFKRLSKEKRLVSNWK